MLCAIRCRGVSKSSCDVLRWPSRYLHTSRTSALYSPRSTSMYCGSSVHHQSHAHTVTNSSEATPTVSSSSTTTANTYHQQHTAQTQHTHQHQTTRTYAQDPAAIERRKQRDEQQRSSTPYTRLLPQPRLTTDQFDKEFKEFKGYKPIINERTFDNSPLDPSFPVSHEISREAPFLGEPGPCRTIYLNDMHTQNALTPDTLHALDGLVRKYAGAEETSAVVIRGRKDGFSVGTNYVELLKSLKKGDKSHQDQFWYMNDLYYALRTAPKPVVVVMDKMTVGAAATLATAVRYPVCTERAVLCWPETSIGFVPEAGTLFKLARLRYNLGRFLALTGTRIRGYNIVRSLLATHIVAYDRLQEMQDALNELHDHSSASTDRFLNVMAYVDGDEEPYVLREHLTTIERCFAHDTVEQIIADLKQQRTKWADKQVAKLNNACPTALKVTLELLVQAENVGKAEAEALGDAEAKRDEIDTQLSALERAARKEATEVIRDKFDPEAQLHTAMAADARTPMIVKLEEEAAENLLVIEAASKALQDVEDAAFDQFLARIYDVSCRMAERSDFTRGIEERIINGNNGSITWDPPTLEAVSPGLVASIVNQPLKGGQAYCVPEPIQQMWDDEQSDDHYDELARDQGALFEDKAAISESDDSSSTSLSDAPVGPAYGDSSEDDTDRENDRRPQQEEPSNSHLTEIAKILRGGARQTAQSRSDSHRKLGGRHDITPQHELLFQKFLMSVFPAVNPRRSNTQPSGEATDDDEDAPILSDTEIHTNDTPTLQNMKKTWDNNNPDHFAATNTETLSSVARRIRQGRYGSSPHSFRTSPTDRGPKFGEKDDRDTSDWRLLKDEHGKPIVYEGKEIRLPAETVRATNPLTTEEVEQFKKIADKLKQNHDLNDMKIGDVQYLMGKEMGYNTEDIEYDTDYATCPSIAVEQADGSTITLPVGRGWRGDRLAEHISACKVLETAQQGGEINMADMVLAPGAETYGDMKQFEITKATFQANCKIAAGKDEAVVRKAYNERLAEIDAEYPNPFTVDDLFFSDSDPLKDKQSRFTDRLNKAREAAKAGKKYPTPYLPVEEYQRELENTMQRIDFRAYVERAHGKQVADNADLDEIKRGVVDSIMSTYKYLVGPTRQDDNELMAGVRLRYTQEEVDAVFQARSSDADESESDEYNARASALRQEALRDGFEQAGRELTYERFMDDELGERPVTSMGTWAPTTFADVDAESAFRERVRLYRKLRHKGVEASDARPDEGPTNYIDKRDLRA